MGGERPFAHVRTEDSRLKRVYLGTGSEAQEANKIEDQMVTLAKSEPDIVREYCRTYGLDINDVMTRHNLGHLVVEQEGQSD